MNVNGLKRKIEYPDFVDMVKNYDVFYVSETHLDSTNIVDIPGYTFISKHRVQKYKPKSGGIGIYVTNKLFPFVDVFENKLEFVLWISSKKTF